MEDDFIDQTDREALLRQKYLSRAPGDAATKAYIASKYLTGHDDEDKKRKKKKKHSSGHKIQQHGNIGIVDEDDWGWSNDKTTSDSSSKKRKKKALSTMVETAQPTNWKTARPINPVADDDDDDEEDKPVVVQDKRTALMTSSGGNQPRMSSGQKAGLLTSKEIQQEAARAKELEQRAVERMAAESGRQGGVVEEETIYRDNTGKKIDPKLAKAEAARQRKLEIERQERKMEWGKGLVQRNEQEQRRKQLAEETHKPLAR
jgi:pre-mRNA-splicing factor CWC26